MREGECGHRLLSGRRSYGCETLPVFGKVTAMTQGRSRVPRFGRLQ
jgi:hypothetical protein